MAGLLGMMRDPLEEELLSLGAYEEELSALLAQHTKDDLTYLAGSTHLYRALETFSKATKVCAAAAVTFWGLSKMNIPYQPYLQMTVAVIGLESFLHGTFTAGKQLVSGVKNMLSVEECTYWRAYLHELIE